MDNIIFQNKLKQFLEPRTLNSIQKYTNEELIALESSLNYNLPLSFQEYLLLAGKKNSLFFDMNYAGAKEFVDLQKQGEMLLNRWHIQNNEPVFIFVIFEDEQLLFIPIQKGDDPPVYRFEYSLFHEKKKSNPEDLFNLFDVSAQIEPSFSVCIENQLLQNTKTGNIY